MLSRILLAPALIFGLSIASPALAQSMDPTSQATFDTVMTFMDALGTGDMETLVSLMAEDMVWQNEGDTEMPWIGPWEGRDAILGFLPIFGANFQIAEWTTEDAFAFGDTVAVFGTMNGITTASGQETGMFTFALRAKVEDGQVVLWNWLEDSHAVSDAFHGR